MDSFLCPSLLSAGPRISINHTQPFLWPVCLGNKSLHICRDSNLRSSQREAGGRSSSKNATIAEHRAVLVYTVKVIRGRSFCRSQAALWAAVPQRAVRDGHRGPARGRGRRRLQVPLPGVRLLVTYMWGHHKKYVISCEISHWSRRLLDCFTNKDTVFCIALSVVILLVWCVVKRHISKQQIVHYLCSGCCLQVHLKHYTEHS